MKKFKTESKKLLDLMINSIYTNKEIFLRELISNSSDAVDKLHFLSLTDKDLDFSKESFEIWVNFDKEARTITVSDNGIGMTKEELDKNLGTIAHSDSMDFKDENIEKQGQDVDIIGQFGVGFYSSFMVAKKVEVISRNYKSKNEDEAWRWSSDGIEGYDIKPATRKERGTDVILYLKEDTDDNNYSDYLEEYKLDDLIKQYSNYVRYTIKMYKTKSKEKPRPKDAGDDYTPEYESVIEVETVNSMVPIWKRSSGKAKKKDYNEFYTKNFHDFSDPAFYFTIHAEGTLNYDALIYVPSQAPYDLYNKGYKKGLQLYTSNVLIMDKCEDLVPDYFNFLKGVVDSQDLTLNISRETLQQNAVLSKIAKRIEKKTKSELKKVMNKDREKYESIFKNFGRVLKFGIYSNFGHTNEPIADLLLFWSAKQKKMITLDEYLEQAKNNQKDIEDKSKDKDSKKQEDNKTEENKEEKGATIYYAPGSDNDRLSKLPTVTTLLDKGYDVLLLTEDVDEFVFQALREYNGAQFMNVTDSKLDIQTEDEKKQTEKLATEYKDLFDEMKNLLGDNVEKVTVSNRVTDAPSCLSSEGPISFEMERVMSAQNGMDPNIQKARRILEVNPKHEIFKTLNKCFKDNDTEKLKLYTSLLYDQALLVEGLPVSDPVEFAKNISKLMN